MSKRSYDSGPGSADPAAEAARIAAEVANRIGGNTWSEAVPDGGIVAGPKMDRSRLSEGAFVKDIEINDLRNRYLLTKESTQEEIFKDTGATVETKGTWIPDTSMPHREAPLYLHIAGKTQQALDAAVERVQKLITQALGPLTHRPGMGEQERPQRRKWPEVKVPIPFEPLRNFNIRAKIVGPGGLFVKYIQQETGARTQIKGIGSGFVETDSGQELQEPMHINLVGPDDAQVERAKLLAEDLLAVVHERWREARMALEYQGGGFGGNYGNYSYQQQGDYQQQGYGQQQYQAPMPSTAPPLPPGAPPSAPQDAAAQQQYAAYMQQINSNPEYAAYYKQLMEFYEKNPQAAAAAGVQPGGAPPMPGGAAPPPPGSAPPPPPGEDRRQGRGQYGGVAPPAGL